MTYPELKKILAAKDTSFQSEVELDVYSKIPSESEKVLLDIEKSKVEIEWEWEMDARSWGIKGGYVAVTTKQIRVPYTLSDFSEGDELNPKVTEDEIELDLPDSEIEFYSKGFSNDAPILYPTSLQIELEGKTEDPKSWKITKATLQMEK